MEAGIASPTPPKTPQPVLDAGPGMARSGRGIAWWAFSLSTGTVGGALTIAAFSALLGHSTPWFVERLTAGTDRKVALRADKIVVSERDVDPAKVRANPALRFHTDKPPDDWRVDTFAPGKLLEGLSIAHVPFFRASWSTFQRMSSETGKMLEHVTTTRISPPGRPVTISFPGKPVPVIGGYPLTFNPADDLDYVRAVVAAARSNTVDVPGLSGTAGVPNDGDLSRMQLKLKEYYSDIINNNWPASIEFAPELSISVYRSAAFSWHPLFRVLLLNEKPTLVTLMSFVMMSNPELHSANVKGISLSTANDVALIDASIELKNVEIDSQKTQRAELTRFVLVGKTTEFVYVVTLSDLPNVSGWPMRDSRRLEELYKSFRIHAR